MLCGALNIVAGIVQQPVVQKRRVHHQLRRRLRRRPRQQGKAFLLQLRPRFAGPYLEIPFKVYAGKAPCFHVPHRQGLLLRQPSERAAYLGENLMHIQMRVHMGRPAALSAPGSGCTARAFQGTGLPPCTARPYQSPRAFGIFRFPSGFRMPVSGLPRLMLICSPTAQPRLPAGNLRSPPARPAY